MIDKKKKEKNESGTEPSKLEKFIRGSVKKRQYQILIRTQHQFHFPSILKPATAIFHRYGEIAKFNVVVYNYYKKYKNYWSTKFSRINKNKDLLALEQKYENVNVNLLAKYLTFKGKFELQKKSDIQILEDIIKIIYWLPLYDKSQIVNEETEIQNIIKEWQEQEAKEAQVKKQIKQNKAEMK